MDFLRSRLDESMDDCPNLSPEEYVSERDRRVRYNLFVNRVRDELVRFGSSIVSTEEEDVEDFLNRVVGSEFFRLVLLGVLMEDPLATSKWVVERSRGKKRPSLPDLSPNQTDFPEGEARVALLEEMLSEARLRPFVEVLGG